MAVNRITYTIPFCVVSITKYDDPLKGSCHGTIDFLAWQKKKRPQKLLDGVFEVWWRLTKFSWTKKIVRTENGFALTDFFAKQKKFRVVRTGPMWQFQLTSSLKGTPQRIGKGNKEDHILVCCLSHARVSTRGSRFNSSLKRNNLQRMQSQLIILSFSFWKRPVDNTCEVTVSSFTSLKKYPVVTSQTITWC